MIARANEIEVGCANAIEIGRADQSDVDGIMALQLANEVSNGGTLSASLPRARLHAMLHAMPLMVARDRGRVVGFLMTTPREMNSDFEIVRATFDAFPGAPDAYLYGPVCVDAQYRGRGLAQAMFDALRALLPGRQGILFIRRDNAASLNAHARMGMTEVAKFTLNGSVFAVLAYTG